MTNKQVVAEMSKDMKMRNFLHYTYYCIDTKVLYEYLINERKLLDRSVNYYNSIIRFMYEVTMDKIINIYHAVQEKFRKGWCVKI